MPQAQYLGAGVLSLESEVHRDGDFRGLTLEGVRAREIGAEKVVAEHALGICMLKNINEKTLSLAERRRAVTYLRNEYAISEPRACTVVSIHRSSYPHEGAQLAMDQAHLEVVRLSECFPYCSYRKIYDLIYREEFPVNLSGCVCSAVGRACRWSKKAEKVSVRTFDPVGGSG